MGLEVPGPHLDLRDLPAVVVELHTDEQIARTRADQLHREYTDELARQADAEARAKFEGTHPARMTSRLWPHSLQGPRAPVMTAIRRRWHRCSSAGAHGPAQRKGSTAVKIHEHRHPDRARCGQDQPTSAVTC
jgi:hypothetical protein